ncbi:MAG: hypothetical protein JO323_07640 [Acidobacteriia bacterium]|nr:hypothetical protein [Terriglobia bacterium]
MKPVHCFLTAAALVLISMPAAAQTEAPRTADGKPDLQGIWQVHNAANFDVSEVAEGQEIPYRPEALEREQKGDRVDPVAHCAMPGVPRITYMPFPFQIVQRPNTVVFVYEYLHNHRIVHTTPREHLQDIDFYMGDSIGRWEGNTLVIDVTNLDEKTWLDAARHTHSDALHVVERYTRVSPTVMNYEANIEDPKTYTRPWKISMALHRRTEPGFELREQECTEGDDGRAIHPYYRPAPRGDPLEFPRIFPAPKEAAR